MPQIETGWNLSCCEQVDCAKQSGNGTVALQSPRLPDWCPAGSLGKQLLHTAGDSSSLELRPCFSVVACFKTNTLHKKKRFHNEDPLGRWDVLWNPLFWSRQTWPRRPSTSILSTRKPSHSRCWKWLRRPVTNSQDSQPLLRHVCFSLLRLRCHQIKWKN